MTILNIGFDASNVIGYGPKGEVILSDKKKNTLHKYQFQQGTYSKVWSRDMPPTLTRNCYKVVSSSGLILLQDRTNSPTFFISEDGREVLRTLQHEGKLVTCLQPTRPVFAVKKEKSFAIVIVDDSSERTLQPAAGRTFSVWLCVCQDDGGRIVVNDASKRTLSIFSGEVGKSPHTSSLDIL